MTRSDDPANKATARSVVLQIQKYFFVNQQTVVDNPAFCVIILLMSIKASGGKPWKL